MFKGMLILIDGVQLIYVGQWHAICSILSWLLKGLTVCQDSEHIF